MLKLVIWDYTGESSEWLEYFLKPNVAEIVRTLRPNDPDQAEVILRGDWDYVLIFANDDSREVFNEILSTMRAKNFSTDNIIFALSISSWVENPAALYSLLKPSKSEKFHRWLNFNEHQKWHHYVACDSNGLFFVGSSTDKFIISLTYLYDVVFESHNIKLFHELAKKFYGTNDDDGYFLDLGANIGTTGIYFLKKLAPNLKLFAVEPDTENFKLLRVNLILNDLDTKSTLVNCGLGEKFDTLTMYRNLENPGNDSFIQINPEFPTETIQIAPLDYLLAESKIAPEEVKYIWIDTEGFEPQVLFGAKNLLAKSNAPVFMEYNPWAWRHSGSFERMIIVLKELGYVKYIYVEELSRTGEEKIYPIENLLLANKKSLKVQIGVAGDIFLIKNH